jgi:hypothetical protein
MAASKEVSDHDAAKHVPEVWTIRRNRYARHDETSPHRTLSHDASPFLQVASGNFTNESFFARAAFRQALDRRGCSPLASLATGKLS